jgi:carboxymethylenebutenolidase
VPFYGSAPPVDQVPKIKAPLMVQLAGVDERINAGYPAYEAALKAAGKTYEVHTYAGCQHGFHNDTTPRYDAENARVAWNRTLEFFAKHVK